MEVISIEQLMEFLRSFNNLSGATVTWRSEADRLFRPHLVVIAGFITIHGNPQFWEVDVDLNDLRTRDDLWRLVDGLHKAFDKAEEKMQQGVADNG
jgi:hypothetical protein